MTGFEPQTSGIGSDRSTNWATTTSPILNDNSRVAMTANIVPTLEW